jgi:dolichyl-diphosphooligosaccharide--protein glycosyltransferase
VAETLLSTIVILFLILAVKSAKKNEITFYSVSNNDWGALKQPLFYSLFAGLFFGCFFLSWKGASLFIFVLLIYAVVQHIIDHMRGASTDYLCIVAIPAFLISLIMVILAYPQGNTKSFHILSLVIGILVFGVLGAISFLMNYKKIDAYGYPIVILVLGILSFVVVNAISPSLYASLTGSLRIFLPGETALTVAEIHPMHIFSPYTGKITDAEAWRWFTTSFFIAFIGFAWLAYEIARKFRAEEILFIVWSAVMLLACWNPFIDGGQNRFAYFYAVNAALLTGFVSWKIIEFVAFRGEAREDGTGEKIKGKKKGGAAAQKTKEKTKPVADKEERTGVAKLKRYARADIVITLILIGLVVFYPPLTTSLATAKYSGGPENDWYESLSWMKENTPSTGVDYYALYEEPPINETTNRFEDYDYPPEAYSVISWWDYGHWITRIAHRIPVANPFQAGIGGPIGSGNPGACVFFVTRDVNEANEVADALGVRYVVSDFMMADAFNAFYNKFGAMTVWAGDTGGYYTQVQTDEGTRVVPSAKYFSTIEARLHVLDGIGVALSEDIFLEPLRHYRLVHESPSTIITFGGQEIKFVKVFEYVNGARIGGTAPNGSIIEIATTVSTNQGRNFVYVEREMSNGTYEFVVPYSTEGPVEGGTNFDVFASPYTLKAGQDVGNATVMWTVEKNVNVSEAAVMEGKTITVDL